MNCGPLYKEDKERIDACKELADFCNLAVEELFPDLLIRPLQEESFLDKTRRKHKDETCIRIPREELLDYMKLPVFISLDKYGPAAVIMPNEVGRLDGKRVILCDPMPPEQAPMIGETVYK